MAAARCFRGDRAALTALRLRRVVSFLRLHRLYDTAHEYARSRFLPPFGCDCFASVCRLERRTGAFFDVAHFRRLLGYFRWADASSYALGREADALIARILIFRLLDDLDGGRTYGVDALFQRIDASLDSDGHHLRKVLLAIRSDRARCFSLYRLAKTKAVDVILNLAAKCPELKAKSQLPRCTFNLAYTLSLGPGYTPSALRLCFTSVVWIASSGARVSTAPPTRTSTCPSLGEGRAVGGRRDYMDRFAPLWDGEGTSQRHAAFMHILQHHAMLDYLACRGDDGGRTASSLFCNDNAAFREKFPEVAQRHDLYRSMASKQARYAIKSMAYATA
ncbi:hypothetical protein HU200_031187 [Digitaria exilis]|uniref:Uncharacterized protein n=1 Tax=Digitaria exilis TaxID=1010633 RepID=A0A835BMY2_9POAL|nr:hypothetical protein HU200_031187 [Digitaria exilis]